MVKQLFRWVLTFIIAYYQVAIIEITSPVNTLHYLIKTPTAAPDFLNARSFVNFLQIFVNLFWVLGILFFPYLSLPPVTRKLTGNYFLIDPTKKPVSKNRPTWKFRLSTKTSVSLSRPLLQEDVRLQVLLERRRQHSRQDKRRNRIRQESKRAGGSPRPLRFDAGSCLLGHTIRQLIRLIAPLGLCNVRAGTTAYYYQNTRVYVNNQFRGAVWKRTECVSH